MLAAPIQAIKFVDCSSAHNLLARLTSRTDERPYSKLRLHDDNIIYFDALSAMDMDNLLASMQVPSSSSQRTRFRCQASECAKCDQPCHRKRCA